jgi:hypothetical protein
MIIECFNEVINNKLDLGDDIKKNLKQYVDTYEDEQLYYILQAPTGIKIDDIFIHFLPNIGFRCSNSRHLGRLPICNILNKILNKKYDEIMNNN